ncbi:hypothetical protein AB22_4531 [Escherichia coli 6-175-07_S1_C1]|nr:hypothetical protein AB22_4531 [Escherichia coli 6-175-07_S1_C1]
MSEVNYQEGHETAGEGKKKGRGYRYVKKRRYGLSGEVVVW